MPLLKTQTAPKDGARPNDDLFNVRVVNGSNAPSTRSFELACGCPESWRQEMGRVQCASGELGCAKGPCIGLGKPSPTPRGMKKRMPLGCPIEFGEGEEALSFDLFGGAVANILTFARCSI